MSEKKISYLSRNFDDYRTSLREFVAKHYPDIANDFDDASIGSWLIDLVSAVADNLSYHIDRVYAETGIDTAEKRSSIYALARSNGLKIPGPKGAMTEAEFSCKIPVTTQYQNSNSTMGMPNWYFAPVLKKGLKMRARNGSVFELMNDVDFTEQFDNNGVSNRTIVPYYDSARDVKYYIVKKRDVVIAGETKVYKMVLTPSLIKPFMEIVIPDTNVMSVESILVKDGMNFTSDPTDNEFAYQKEFVPANESVSESATYRFFEVNSLLEQYRWGDDMTQLIDGIESNAPSKAYKYGYFNQEFEGGVMVETMSVTKGAWVPLTQKFITEYTDNGYLKVIFGSGDSVGQDSDIENSLDFSKYQITKMVRNNFLGKLPKSNATLYIQYRVGGGNISNIPADTLTGFINLDSKVESKNCAITSTDNKIAGAVKESLTVTNTIPSVSGKDMPTVDEIRAMIKYNNSAQERCVTVKDYEDRIAKMPPRYGCPFRFSVTEENNKVMMYLLGVDQSGHLTNIFPEVMMSNIQNYLSFYRSINDYVEIKSGRIVNISIEADVYVDKNYNTGDVVKNIISVIKDYMDINKHKLGEDLYIGDLHKEIGKVDGVLNLIEIRVYNETGDNYSPTQISQDVIYETDDGAEANEEQLEIDLDSSDYILNSDADEMFEIKFPERDIRIRVKSR